MVFNDTSTKLGLIQECEDLCQTGSANISGSSALLASFVRGINKWVDKIQLMILSSQTEWDFDDSNHTDFPIMTTDLENGVQNYSFPSEGLEVKRAEISYNGTDWYKLMPIDTHEISIPTDTSSIASNFSKSSPYYDIVANAIFLYPIPDADQAAGLKLWVSREMSLFTASDTTKEPGFDRQFHEMLALGASYDYCKARQLPQASVIKQDLVEMEIRLKEYYKNKQQDRQFNLKGKKYNFK